MFDPHQKPTGNRYTMTVTLLVIAIIFSPAVLIMSRPIGYFSGSLALACSILCVTFAWLNWKMYSQLTVPSIETPPAKSK